MTGPLILTAAGVAIALLFCALLAPLNNRWVSITLWAAVLIALAILSWAVFFAPAQPL